MKVNVYDTKGQVVGEVDLPPVFETPLRPDLIRRAVRIFQMNRRQPYGVSPEAGRRRVAESWGPGYGMSRVPRLARTGRAAFAPGTVGGRKAHPPRAEKVWARKMNRKERRLAKLSALAATSLPEVVRARGHRVPEGLTLPIVVRGLESLERISQAKELLLSLGLGDELERAHDRKMRAGKGKMRGRRYRVRKSLLVVVSSKDPVEKAFSNIPGVEVLTPRELNAEVLAPGGDPGRLLMLSEEALKEIGGWESWR